MNALSKVETGTMTSKGQVLIPKSIREAAGLVPGRPYKVAMDEKGQVVVLPVGLGPQDSAEREKLLDEALDALAGKFPFGKSTDEVMRDLRGDYEP